tara:strand:- start:151 stop:921 length:771 start_codon:yes stop_codon:yes gene_type:complete
MKIYRHIAILSAMPEEIGSILNNLSDIKISQYGDLTIKNGLWTDPNTKNKIYITTAWSGWGKVSAARAATRIICLCEKISMPIDLFIFTGVAGAINSDLKQWDIIIPNKVCQYDMDARPIFEKYAIPPLKKKYLKPNTYFHQWAFNCIKKNLKKEKLSKFGILSKGLIGTADKFISSVEARNLILKDLPEMQAVEMEGASFAQIASQENINWILIRVISDSASDAAAQSFNDFLKDYSKFSWKILEILLKNFKKQV